MADDPQDWTDLALQLRADAIRCTTMAGSGHPTSCLSAADLMAVLLASHLHWDASRAEALENDCVVRGRARLAQAQCERGGRRGDDSEERRMDVTTNLEKAVRTIMYPNAFFVPTDMPRAHAAEGLAERQITGASIAPSWILSAARKMPLRRVGIQKFVAIRSARAARGRPS